MITTISLVSIHHHIVTHIFFLVMGTFKIYSLSNFLAYNTALYTTVTMLWASLIAQLVKTLPATQETPILFLCRADLLEKG